MARKLARRMGGAALLALVTASLALAGCGAERQDENEPEGEFTLQVVDASFPERQSTAQSATLRISVRNTDDRDLPNLAVTIKTTAPGGGEVASAFGQSSDDQRLADDDRPIWVVDEGPTGGASAYTNTWSVGRTFPGQTRELEWKLTAVRPGAYTVDYTVAPGLDGRAVAAGGQRTTGSFDVEISADPVPARVGKDGEVIRGEPGQD
jgi:hypothetical protein